MQHEGDRLSLETELIFQSVALDVALECLAKITGKSATEWGTGIAEITAKMLDEISPEDLERILRTD